MTSIFLFAAILVTGGFSNDADGQHSAEVILPQGLTCSMPDLPSPGKYYHIQSGYTACGGYFSPSCHTFNGEWEAIYELSEQRIQPVSWKSPNGTLIIGGGWSNTAASRTAELLSATDNTTSILFRLPYRTK